MFNFKIVVIFRILVILFISIILKFWVIDGYLGGINVRVWILYFIYERGFYCIFVFFVIC